MTRRVLFCTQTAHVHGGLETWLDEFVPFLRAHEWEPRFAFARGPRFHDPDAYRAAHPAFRGVEIHGATRELRVASIRGAIREIEPHLVVPVNVADALEAAACAKRERQRVRLLVMLRAQVPWGELEDIRRFRDFIDVAVGGNRLLRALIAEWGRIPPERLRYIPTGTRRGRSHGSLRHTGDEPIRLAYVGRLEERDKRVLDLVDVVRELDARGVHYTLTIAGAGSARDALAFALGDRARFLGEVSVDALYDSLYPNVDALLLFSTAEAGPQVVFQAMHFGVVPISSRYVGARAEGLLRDGETAMLFDVGDTATAAAHVERLANDVALRERIAAAAARAVEPRYILDHSFGEYLAAFNDAVAMPPAIGARLPHREPSGVFERLHVPWLRTMLGRVAEPRDPGDEWPHHGPIDAATVARLEQLARELDK